MMKTEVLNYNVSKYLLSILVALFGFVNNVQAFDLKFETFGSTEIKEGESVDVRVSFIADPLDDCSATFSLADPIGDHDRIDATVGPAFATNTANESDLNINPSRYGFALSYSNTSSDKHADIGVITYTARTDMLYSEVTEFFQDHYILETSCSFVGSCGSGPTCHSFPSLNSKHFPKIAINNVDERVLLTPQFTISQSVVEKGAGELTIAEVNITPEESLNNCRVSVSVSVDESSTAIEGVDFELLPNPTTGIFDIERKNPVPIKINVLENLSSNKDAIIKLKAEFNLLPTEVNPCVFPDSGLPIIKEVKINARRIKSDLSTRFDGVNVKLNEGSGASKVANIVFKLPSNKEPDDHCNATASVKVIGGTAELGKDYNFTEKLISYKLGDANSKTVPINLEVLAGVADENKTIKLQAIFSNTIGESSSCPLVGSTTKELNIEITDDPYEKPNITLTSSFTTPTEGEAFTMIMSMVEENPRLSSRSIGNCKMSIDWMPSTKPGTSTKPGKGIAKEGLDYIFVNKPNEVDFSKSNPLEIKMRALNDEMQEGNEKLEIVAVLKGKASANNPQCALIPETQVNLTTNVMITDKTELKIVIPDPEVLNDRICNELLNSVGGAGKESDLQGIDKKYYDSNCKNQTEETKRNFEPEEIATQTNAVLGAANRQLRNIRARLDKLRTSDGQRGIDATGVNVNIQGTSLSFGLLGGGASGDENELLKNSRWGLFANGEYAFGDKNRGNDSKAGSGDRNFDFNSTGLTIGADYRFPGEKMIAGAAIGYKDFKSDFSDQKGNTNTKGTNVSLYGTYLLSDKSYLDAVIGFGKDRIDSRRPVNNDGSTSDATFAIGKPDAKEYTFSVGGGYEIHRKEWTYTPYGRLDYTKGTIDAYKEFASHESAETSMLSINKQTIESLTSSLGVKASRVYSTSKGVFIPHASLEWKHDFKERGAISGNSVFLQELNTSLFSNDQNSAFEESDRSKLDTDYYNLSLGVSAVLPKGRSAYLNFESRLGDSSIKDNAVKAGFRWEF